jgi:phosphatidylglycerophosphate synthase
MGVKDHQGVAFLGLGGNMTRVFGLTPAERANRFAAKAKLAVVDRVPDDGAVIIADLGFAWDPAWLAQVRDRVGLAVTWRGRPALVHCHDAAEARAVIAAIEEGGPLPPGFGFAMQDAEGEASLYNATLRKREDAYLVPLTLAAVPAIEKASYDASYKGVTDVLTLYLWRGVAFRLTRWAAYMRMTPNMVTMIGIALCVWAFFLFWGGHYAGGLLVGLIFMVLDTVDGKLARCTGTSSEWGNILDHGVDLVHPPFWYWAWGMGLASWSLAFSGTQLWEIMAVLVAGYAVQRAIEGAFIASFGIHIHVWERIDSRFRLVTARRNPNFILLVASLIVARPDWGLLAVVWWTVLSCLFHLVRLMQAYAARSRGREILSWLA